MNNFKSDLAFSLNASDNEAADNIYYKLFPHLVRIENITDKKQQLQGIDKKLYFTDGNFITIDEKYRRKFYGDILLEEYSNFEKKKLGWLSREKHTDYISYIFLGENKLYFLPFLILQMAWINNHKKWLALYGRKLANNKYYQTSNIAIPVDILFKSMEEIMNIDLNKIKNIPRFEAIYKDPEVYNFSKKVKQKNKYVESNQGLLFGNDQLNFNDLIASEAI